MALGFELPLGSCPAFGSQRLSQGRALRKVCRHGQARGHREPQRRVARTHACHPSDRRSTKGTQRVGPWGEAMPRDGPPPPTSSRPASHLTWICAAEASSMAYRAPSPRCFFFFAGEGAVFLKGKCDHTILTQDPSLAPHRPQDKALKALLAPVPTCCAPQAWADFYMSPGFLLQPHPHPGPQTTEAGRGGPSRRPPHVATKATSSTTSVSPWERRPWLRTTALDYWWNF